MERKTALITGATSGIGMATARLFAQNNIRLIACGRRKEQLEQLQKELQNQTDIHILDFDVSDKKAVFERIQSLPEAFSQIDILINNAGNAHGLDPIQNGNLDDWDAMLDINVKGLLYVSKAVIPQMTERGSGHIINIGSIAGKEVYPNGNVYCASKHAVDAINKAMQIDLNGTGVRVGAVHPGLVKTGFSEVRFKGNKERAKLSYESFQPLLPEDIADVILFAVTRPSRVNIADLLVMPTDQANCTVANRKTS